MLTLKVSDICSSVSDMKSVAKSTPALFTSIDTSPMLSLMYEAILKKNSIYVNGYCSVALIDGENPEPEAAGGDATPRQCFT